MRFAPSHDKTYNDFIKCTKLPTNSEICFLDDTFYPEMANDNFVKLFEAAANPNPNRQALEPTPPQIKLE